MFLLRTLTSGKNTRSTYVMYHRFTAPRPAPSEYVRVSSFIFYHDLTTTMLTHTILLTSLATASYAQCYGNDCNTGGWRGGYSAAVVVGKRFQSIIAGAWAENANGLQR